MASLIVVHLFDKRLRILETLFDRTMYHHVDQPTLNTRNPFGVFILISFVERKQLVITRERCLRNLSSIVSVCRY